MPRPQSSLVRGESRLRITLLTQGSRGDVEPYLALGFALARLGHELKVAAPAGFAPLIRRAGLEAFLVEPDPRLRAVGEDLPRWLRPSVGEGVIRMRRAARPRSGLGQAYSGYLQASRDADVILHPAWLAPVARTIAECCGSLAVPAYLAPIHPTRAFPSPFLNISSRPEWNHPSHVMALWLGRAVLHGAPNHWRSRILGLPPARVDFLPPAGSVCLYGFSRSLLPPPRDWPAEARVTGSWWLDAGQDWKPPEDLDRFLRGSGKVVFLGFGSMMDPRPKQLNAIVEAALARVGCRAVVLLGPHGQLDLARSPHWMAVPEVPFDWLFRRVDAIVHHGGAGTAAQAARAGKPSVVVPFFGDQLFWGQRLHRTGGGLRPIPRRALSEDRLASAIEEALENPERARHAASLGERVRAEAGLATAVEIIETVAEQGRSRRRWPATIERAGRLRRPHRALSRAADPGG